MRFSRALLHRLKALQHLPRIDNTTSSAIHPRRHWCPGGGNVVLRNAASARQHRSQI